MPAKSATTKPTGVMALARLRAQRGEFEKREREARRLAAIELGEAVLKAADLALEPSQLSQLIAATMRHGFEPTMALLNTDAVGDSRPPLARKSGANGSGSPEPNGALSSADQGSNHVA